MTFPVRVSDIMSQPVETIGVEETAGAAATACFEKNIGSLVVLEEGELAGILTTMDFVKLLGTTSAPEGQPARAVMSTPVITVSPEKPVTDAVAKMNEHGIGRLVVLDEGSVVGLLSTDDIVRYVPQVFHRQELPTGTGPATDHRHEGRPETAYEKADWEFECSMHSTEEPTVGDWVSFSKAVSEQDVRSFAAASGDTNRLHLDEAYASRTRFGRRIVHGTLVGGLISAALARLPGLTIYVSQDLSFRGPVDIGDHLTAVCEIVETFGRDKYQLTTDVHNGAEQPVLEGEAVVLIDIP